MESHPSKIAAEPVKTIKIVGIELKKRAPKLSMGDPLDVYLRGYEDEYPKNKGDEQPFESFTQVLAGTPEVQRQSGALARQDKKDGHDPLNQDTHKNGKSQTQLRVFDMPVLVVEVSGAVEKKNGEHGKDPQPIDVVPSCLFHYRFLLPAYFMNNPDNMINLFSHLGKDK